MMFPTLCDFYLWRGREGQRGRGAERQRGKGPATLLFIGFTHANTTFYKLNPTNTFVIKISGIGCANTKHFPLEWEQYLWPTCSQSQSQSGFEGQEQREQTKLIRITTNMTRQ